MRCKPKSTLPAPPSVRPSAACMPWPIGQARCSIRAMRSMPLPMPRCQGDFQNLHSWEAPPGICQTISICCRPRWAGSPMFCGGAHPMPISVRPSSQPVSLSCGPANWPWRGHRPVPRRRKSRPSLWVWCAPWRPRLPAIPYYAGCRPSVAVSTGTIAGWASTTS